MDKIKLEILQSNYLEHFKFAKDLSFFLPIDHPKRQMIEGELNKIQREIEKLKKIK